MSGESDKVDGDLRAPSNAPGGRVPLSGQHDEAPGVPGFRTWRGVYLFVLGCFIAMVVALTVFTHFHA
jgi:hypothetical protein